jgi:hypothetical protein
MYEKLINRNWVKYIKFKMSILFNPMLPITIMHSKKIIKQVVIQSRVFSSDKTVRNIPTVHQERFI